MTFIRTHWFGLITGSAIFVFLMLFILVLLSPRQDKLKRGFIPCTEMLAEELSVCMEQKRVACLLGSVMKNSWCQLKTVGRGIKLWVYGQQSAPWSNYIFIPEQTEEADFPTEERTEYLKNNPGFFEEMQNLKQSYKELENEQTESNTEELPK